MVALGRVGASVYHPVGISWVGKHYKDELDDAMGTQSAFGDAGVILAFASSGFLGVHLGWQVPFLVWGGLALAMAPVGYALTGGLGTRAPPRAAKPNSWGTILRRVALWIVPLSIGGAAYVITISYGNSFLVDRLGFTTDLADLVIALWIGAGVVAATLFGRISRLLGRFRALSWAFLLIALSGFVISLAPPPVVLIPTFVLFGVALFITYPALFAFISESTDVEIEGATFGVVFGFQLVGGALMGYLAGILADALGIHTPFLLLVALGLGTFVLLAVATPTHLRNRRLPAAAAPTD
jgi:MFS family permease